MANTQNSASEDGLRLCLNWFARHGDTEMAPAAANIITRMDGNKDPGYNPLDISAPPAVVQEHVGKGEYLGVEVKPEEVLKAPDLGTPVQQISGVTSVGKPLPGKENAPAADQVSVQESSTPTSATVAPAKK